MDGHCFLSPMQVGVDEILGVNEPFPEAPSLVRRGELLSAGMALGPLPCLHIPIAFAGLLASAFP